MKNFSRTLLFGLIILVVLALGEYYRGGVDAFVETIRRYGVGFGCFALLFVFVVFLEWLWKRFSARKR